MNNIMIVSVLSLILTACGSRVVEFPFNGNDSGNNNVESGVSDSGTNVSDGSYSDASDKSDSDSGHPPPPPPVCLFPTVGSVDLGTASNFAILAKSGISTVPASAITGDIGVSPIARIGLTGFSETMDSSGTFSTSAQVTGKLYASDYISPTPSNMTTAISDMETAFNVSAGRAPSSSVNIDLGAGDIGGLTLPPGVYKWSTGLLIPTNVTLQGNCGDVWIFEIAQDLTVSNGVNVFLAGGALSKNIFWQVSGQVDVGTTAHVEGSILTKTQVAMHTGSSVNGRLLAQTAVTLEQTTVVKP